MESGPVRSQALHNFALPFWGKNNKLHRKFIDSSEQQQQQQSSSPLHHNSSSSCSETQFQPNIHGNHKQQPEFQNPKNLIVSKSVNKNRSSSSPVQHKKNQTNFSESVDIVVDEVKLNSVNRHHRSAAVEKVNKSEGVVVEGEESTPKPWNLRPRRVFKTPTTEINVGGGGANKNGEFREKTENLPKSLRLRGFIEGGQTVENKEKRKFWISLSREEIELDFFVLTGSKPPRKPKKRSKIVQNQLDNVFPGLWMVGASVDSYTVPNGSAKR